KLMEIDARDHLLKAGLTVLELGAAPGSWSQYVAQRVGSSGRIIALDALAMAPLGKVEFVQGDFCDDETPRRLRALLATKRADLVLSDMAPNITGITAIDQPRAMELAELALQLAQEVLKPGGDFLVKLFQGEGFDRYVTAVQGLFVKAAVRKPAASRPHSREVYLMAKNYQVTKL
ncbi:MAG TPA: SAM-dependent methyltransferase, partial [Gammaproteobacteria bacterium]|nr:SAM-dependent methyltransferase [Gammaproteobacteria bacterium]